MSIKYKGQTIANAGGGRIEWENINGRPDLSTVSSMKAVPVLLPAGAWSENAQTIAVGGILEDETAQLIIPAPASASRAGYMSNGIQAVSASKGTLTFSAETEPSEDISVIVYIIGAAEVGKEIAGGTFEWWSPQMTSNTAPEPYTAESSGIITIGSNIYEPYRAFDGNTSTMWHGPNKQDNYIAIHFGSGIVIKGVSLMANRANNHSYSLNLPRTFSVYGRNGDTEWNQIQTFHTELPKDGVVQKFEFDKAVRYKSYRIQADSVDWEDTYHFCAMEIQFLKLVEEGGNA